MKKKHEEQAKKEKERLSSSKSPSREPIFPKTFQERTQLPKYFAENQVTMN